MENLREIMRSWTKKCYLHIAVMNEFFHNILSTGFNHETMKRIALMNKNYNHELYITKINEVI